MISKIVKIVRGSVIYGTCHDGSDIDELWIVPDLNCFADQYGYEIGDDGYLHIEYKSGNGDREIIFDIQVMSYEQFVKLVDNYDIMAIEALYSSHPLDENHEAIDHLRYKTIDTWKLRQSISAVCNNSWAKFHKKLTVEKDYNLYIGLKSLFHVLRMYRYGTQLARYGKIVDFTCDEGSSLETWSLKKQYDFIIGLPSQGCESYELIKSATQPLRNHYASELKKYCPKPITK